jgi:hypothetical protein
LYLEGVPRRLLRPLAPERVDQLVARDDLVGVQQQAREQQRLATGAERDLPAVVNDFERSENAEFRRLLPSRVTPSSA